MIEYIPLVTVTGYILYVITIDLIDEIKKA